MVGVNASGQMKLPECDLRGSVIVMKDPGETVMVNLDC